MAPAKNGEEGRELGVVLHANLMLCDDCRWTAAHDENEARKQLAVLTGLASDTIIVAQVQERGGGEGTGDESNASRSCSAVVVIL